MKKMLLIGALIVTFLIPFGVHAETICEFDEINNLCNKDPRTGVCFPSFLFSICDKIGETCITIGTDTIDNDQVYDNFEVKNKKRYI